jgi:competence protein ComEC
LQKIQALIKESLVPALADQKNRLLCWAPFFLGLGIGFYFALKTEPPWEAALVPGFICAVITLVLAVQRERGMLWITALLLCLAGLCMAAGFGAAKWRTERVQAPMIEKEIRITSLSGIVEAIEPMEDGGRMRLSHLEIEDIPPEKTPSAVRIKLRDAAGLAPGQRVYLLAGLNPPSQPVAPGAFDFQRLSYFQQLGAVGFAYGTPEVLSAGESSDGLANLRDYIGKAVNRHSEGPPRAVLRALMTGQRGEIRETDWEALRGSGLAHMLAISGLHVGMVAGILFFASRLLMALIPTLALHYPIKKYAALIAFAGAFFYMLLVGATIPTQRAVIMTGLVMLAICLDRSPISLRLVAIAALAILLYRPESLLSVSFQMSFAAVAALVAFFDRLRPWWRRAYSHAGIVRRAALYILGLSFTTIIAGTVTGIFALYHFQQFAVYGLLANLIAVPLLAFIVMPAMVAGYVALPLQASGVFLNIAEWGVSWILATAHWVAGLEGAVWRIAAFPQEIFVAMVICLFIWAVWEGPLARVMPVLIAALFSLIFFVKQPDIQISSRAELIAVRAENDTLWFSSGRAARFTGDNWQRRNGHEGEQKQIWPKSGVEGFPLQCDVYACRGEMAGRNIAIIKERRALAEECAWADMVIAQVPVNTKDCSAPVLIDFFDTWRHGAHAIWLAPMVIKTVEEERGERPWTQ